VKEMDFHPEDLLDRARRDDLSDAEREQLEDHLAVCSSCALELEVGHDFELLDSARPGDDAVLARIAAGAMAEIDADAVTREVDSGDSPRAKGRSARRAPVRFLAAAAVLVVVVGGALAATYVLPEILAGDDSSEQDRSDRGAKKRAPVPAVPPAVADDEAEEAEEEPLEMEPDLLPRARKPKTARRPVESDEPPSAAELLARANAARGRGENQEAATLYRTLQKLYPKSREQRASRVALGRLLIDRLGDAEAALGQFEYYLTRYAGDTLAEEARVGRAIALGKLGRRLKERAAWQDLIKHHPSSPHATRAQRRIDELGGTR